MPYDFLIVGAGLSGATFAYLASRAGYRCLVLERDNHVGGQCYSELIDGIHVHKYGAHIFNTNSKVVYDLVNGLEPLNHFVNSPIANYKGELYNLPLNMNTYYQLWGVRSPEEARQMIEKQKVQKDAPDNLEDHLLNMVGVEVYEKIFRHYTEKQWGQRCKDLPAEIISRIPFRFTFDNNYSNAKYQGVPKNGYTSLIEKMLEGSQVLCGIDYLKDRAGWDRQAHRVIYTGAIDECYGYSLGCLGYRSLRFEAERLEVDNYQGVAVMNFTGPDEPYTRIIEHKHFVFGGGEGYTIITREYPDAWAEGKARYYPLLDQKSRELHLRYMQTAQEDPKLYLLGRLAQYRYLNMGEAIEGAMALFKRFTGGLWARRRS